MFWKNKINKGMIPNLRPTSKAALKQQCLLIANGDIDKAIKLYDFMIKNNSRILFAKIEDLEIIILGGVKFFIESEFCYPLCLSNIEIL